jgi:hypothetical protein
MAAKLLSNDDTVSAALLGAALVEGLDELDEGACVVVGAAVLDELLHAVPIKPSAARRETPPAMVLAVLFTPILL